MILVINKSKKAARNLAEAFYYMGIIAYGTTPSDALSEISLRYSAVIIMNPSHLADKGDYISRLRSYAQVPVFAMTDEPEEKDDIIFDKVLKLSTYISVAMDKIGDYCHENGLRIPGVYKLMGLDLSFYLNTPTYMFSPLSLTKTELMILRTLIRTYPQPTGAKEILKYAFKQSRLPDPANVRTHISIINKKFRSMTERNLITLTVREGYRILTPEIIDARLGKSK